MTDVSEERNVSAAYTHKQSFCSFGSLFRKVPQSPKFEIGKPMNVSSCESVFSYSANSLNLTTGETKVRALPLAGVPVPTLPLQRLAGRMVCVWFVMKGHTLHPQ